MLRFRGLRRTRGRQTALRQQGDKSLWHQQPIALVDPPRQQAGRREFVVSERRRDPSVAPDGIAIRRLGCELGSLCQGIAEFEHDVVGIVIPAHEHERLAPRLERDACANNSLLGVRIPQGNPSQSLHRFALSVRWSRHGDLVVAIAALVRHPPSNARLVRRIRIAVQHSLSSRQVVGNRRREVRFCCCCLGDAVHGVQSIGCRFVLISAR